MPAFEPEQLENLTFDEIEPGQSARLTRTLRLQDIQLFAVASGDLNPTHLDSDYARDVGFSGVVAHSMWGGTLVSSLLGSRFPGPGTVYRSQNLRFLAPLSLGDTLTVTITCIDKHAASRCITMRCEGANQDGLQIFEGEAEVIAPAEKVRKPVPSLPEITVNDQQHRYGKLLALTDGLAPVRIAVAWPCSEDSLLGPLQARDEGLVVPVLVGPRQRIHALAEKFGADLSGVEIVDAEFEADAAKAASALARDGRVGALMKGSLHTDTFMGAVIARDAGLRTGRRVSHVFVADVPTYPRPLLITDAAINIEPILEEKVDILQNAIELAHAMGIKLPRVAILSAVEMVTTKIRSTFEAAALCKMGDRGQITGALLDGPLAFDNAISIIAARAKGIESEVAGRADILLVPDMEAGNMLAKQLHYLAGALLAGVVLGAKVPIVLTSRADSAESRSVSCAIAQLLSHRKPAAY
ncbi:bifunctional enoyl-CoA hydratase/phosphate acetyltransferase [Niveibacterium sp. 24ML]|uniref:bifunctional enoyl-CoA hydratase/phosphate acetyltransferase n=1 Tax=Niveibacterium sp. 24ML TaxID=2985512 RepID=UPI00226D80BA|nr:bifunctional enoyl-CoA hydratase/phosphate acetyltransferase [Niveibacterium sp. 24ML]MCX9155469.1 bifunctional enoyl-CoA hydratase/phosphate acetyltransferase [Niveibacterium sp. 24ML]